MGRIKRFIFNIQRSVVLAPKVVKSAALEWTVLGVVTGLMGLTTIGAVPKQIKAVAAPTALALTLGSTGLSRRHIDNVRVARADREFKRQRAIEQSKAFYLPHEAEDYLTAASSQTQVMIARALNFDEQMKVQAAGGGGKSHAYRRYFFNVEAKTSFADPYRAAGQIRAELALNEDQGVIIHEAVPGHQGMAVDIGLSEGERSYPSLTDHLGNIHNRVVLFAGMDDNKPRLLDVERDVVTSLLVGGQSGSGKSEWLKVQAQWLTTHYDDETVGLALIDLKSEDGPATFLSSEAWNDLPHMVAPVAFRITDALRLLFRLWNEIKLRVGEMSAFGCSDIWSFNRRYRQEAMAHIFCFIDEAQTFATSPLYYQIYEFLINEIARTGRAAGVHAIVGYQRASKDEIPLILRSNCSHSFCLSVKDANNAALILGVANEDPILVQATQLAGKGDMIAKLNGVFIRLQGLRSNKKIDDLPVVCSASAQDMFESGAPVPFWDMPEWDEVVSHFQRGKKAGKSESPSSQGSSGEGDSSAKQKQPAKVPEGETLKLMLTKWREYNPAEKGHSITHFITDVLKKPSQGNAFHKTRTALDNAIYTHGQGWADEIVGKHPDIKADQLAKLIWGPNLDGLKKHKDYKAWATNAIEKAKSKAPAQD